jgi:hypothetical protein
MRNKVQVDVGTIDVPSDDELLRMIERVCSEHPDLNANGIRFRPRSYPQYSHDTLRAEMTTPKRVAEFRRALAFLRRFGAPTFIEGWNGSSSYSWKHMVEYWWPGTGDHYVSNGMFIAAALAVGARIKTYPGSPNVALNLSRTMQFAREAVS